MTQIPSGDILKKLYKLRIRESDKLKTVLELYDLETHQKKLGPDYHRLKAMVKRSIEQEIRNKNFGNRIGNFEKDAVAKNQGTKQRVQRILGDCRQWETNGQCVKGNNCSFRHDTNKRGKSSPLNPSPNSFMQQNERKPSRTRSPRGKSPSGRMSRWPCKIIHYSHFKRRVSLEEQEAQKEDRFLRGRQIAYLIYDYFRVTGANDSVENYTDLFTIALRNDDIQEFDSKCDGISLSMTKILSDDILEGLYKLRIRESGKPKTVLELYDLEIHQKKAGRDYHRLKTMVKKYRAEFESEEF